MYFKLKCPHCDKSLKVREELAGKKCVCPYCKGSVRIPKEAAEDSPAPEEAAGGFPNIDVSAGTRSPVGKTAAKPAKPKPKAEIRPAGGTGGSGAAADTSDVSLVKSGLIGLGCAVVFLVLLFPLRSFKFAQLFWDRGSVPFALTLLTAWSFAILVLKWRKINQQKQTMLLDVLPTELSREITLDSLDKFESHIHGLPGEAAESFLINRVIRGLEHFRVRKSAAETVTMMESQSDIDANNVASSYTIIKVFIWALPILGFIGTVVGVSGAVGGLGASLESASDISAVKESLKSVFGNLGVAFDTTLLALVLSMIVKIPTSALQKSEEDLVTWVDEYCNENLLKRLNDGREGGAERGAAGGDTSVFRQAVEAALATYQAELESWSQRLETVGGKLTSQVAEGWKDISRQVQSQMAEQTSKSHQQQQEHTEALLKQYQERLDDLQKQSESLESERQQQQQQWQTQMTEMGELAAKIHDSLAGLGDQAQSMQSDMAQSINGTGQALQEHFSGLERGLTSLSDVLQRLGEQQVVVQQVEPPKRGWFRRGNGRR